MEGGKDVPVAVVVHKAVRRERIRPYRRSVPVSRETSSSRPGRFKASIREDAHPAAWQGGAYTYAHTHTYVHDAYGSRAGSRRGGERIIEAGKMISLLHYTTHEGSYFPSKLVSMQLAIHIGYMDVNLFNK